MKAPLIVLSFLIAAPALAAGITIEDAYARASRPGAPTGAMFFTIRNRGEEADRLIGAASPAAQIVELHTHIENDGVMRMRPIEDGIEIPAGGMHKLERGGDHVMLMGVTTDLVDGESVPLFLAFEKAGEIAVDVVVDNERRQGHDD